MSPLYEVEVVLRKLPRMMKLLLSFSVVQVSEVNSSNATDIDSKMEVLTGTITIVLGHTFITENFTLLDEQKY